MDSIYLYSTWVLPLLMLAVFLANKGHGGAPIKSISSTSNIGLPYVLLASMFFLWFGLHNLSEHAATFLNWECEVSAGFLESLKRGDSFMQHAMDLLIWSDGTVARGDQSLLYGLPTYELLRSSAISTFNLRISAVVATFISIWLFYGVVSTAYGRASGAIAAILFALNPAVLYYSKYGTSLSATVLSVMLSFGVILYWQNLRPRSHSLPYLAVIAMFIATLHYSPARILTLIALGLLIARTIVAIFRDRSARWTHTHTLLVLTVLPVAIGAWQHHQRGFDRFLMARGEQAFELLKNPEYVKEHLGEVPAEPSVSTQVLFFETLASKRILELWKLYSPLSDFGLEAQDVRAIGDPPELKPFQVGLTPFILLGILIAAKNIRRFENQLALGWIFLGSLPLLFTNRVDLHRIFVFIPTLLIFGAIGISECLDWLGRLPGNRWLRVVAVPLLCLTLYAYDRQMFGGEIQVPAPFLSAKSLIDSQPPGKVLLAARYYCGDIYWLNFEMAGRSQTQPDFQFDVLDPAITDSLTNDRLSATDSRTPDIYTRLSGYSTSVFFPAEQFSTIAKSLPDKGFRTVQRDKLLIVSK